MQDRSLTLPQILARSARASSPVTIVTTGGRSSRTRQELFSDADRIAGGLFDAGIAPGTRIAVPATITFGFISCCLGIWKMGGVVVPLPPQGSGSRDGSRNDPSPLLRVAGVRAVIDGNHPPTDPASWDVLHLGDLRRGSPYDGAQPSPEHEALIQSSSGSTGMAKGVLLTHGALAGYLNARADYLDPIRGEGNGFVSWLPLHHDMGFVNNLLHPLLTPDPLILMPPTYFVQDPLSWLREIASSRAGSSASPNFGYGLAARKLERWEGDPLDLSCWKIATVGGEPLDAAVLERFQRAAEPHGFDPRAFAPGYGLAEATCAVASRPRKHLLLDHVDRPALSDGKALPSSQGERSVTIVSVGPPNPGFRLRVVDASGSSVPERCVGEIAVKSDFLMRGYVMSEGMDADGGGVDEGGWLRTGDRGYLVEDELFVTGRIKDLIIVHGRNYHAEEIESVATLIEGVRPGGCVAFPAERVGGSDRLVVVIETRLTSSTDLQHLRSEVRRRIRSEVGLVASEVLTVTPGSIPKTTSGKLQRKRAQRLHAEGSLVREVV